MASCRRRGVRTTKRCLGPAGARHRPISHQHGAEIGSSDYCSQLQQRLHGIQRPRHDDERADYNPGPSGRHLHCVAYLSSDAVLHKVEITDRIAEVSSATNCDKNEIISKIDEVQDDQARCDERLEDKLDEIGRSWVIGRKTNRSWTQSWKRSCRTSPR